ncbi:MAG: hypothetical protein JJ953_11795 [Gracilimonas sp.]|uniref:KAP family P-loop NTPase fold protein n=1 Tax=Gracilimonas sp. TaxID=1974203 RepID=UPI001B257CD0|nr:P-loop NTPase fold protein [Gracilimonas sp.]MBO6586781.1 hypothetical protein [Gracilimonas sp.]MBO6615438.1 hypothetical protein [Gracilimonas sp.]
MGEGEEKIDKVITDLALEDPAQDKFGRDEFAKRVAKILIGKSTPDHLTVGIYGKWGDGKTSVINFIKYYLNEEHEGEALYIDFNPWRYKNEEHLLNSFFKQFAQGISHKLDKEGKKIAKTLLAYSGLIVALAEPVTGLAMFSQLGGWDKIKDKFGKGKDFVNDTDFSPAINSLEESLKNSESLEKQKKRISEQLSKTGKKHIVFIDDIDRLDSEEVQVLFGLLKVTADFDNVIYVLGFDPTIVSKALEPKYPDSGRDFLDKIIQVPLNLPKVQRTDLYGEILYPGLNEIIANNSIYVSEDENNDIVNSIQNGLEDKLNTPRIVKRYLNALTFSVPILKGEVRLHDLLMIEGLRICYPDIYENVYENKDLFISSEKDSIFPDPKEVEKKEAEQRESLLENQGESVRNILSSLFPRIQTDFLGQKPDIKELARKQRISSSYYFDRYFTYSIPKMDLSDQQVGEFIIGLPTESVDLSVQRATQLIENSSEGAFLRKIEENEREITKTSSPNLAFVLSKLGHRFRKYDDAIMDFNSPLRKASYLIATVIESIDPKNRLETAERVINECSNIILTAEISRDLYRDKDKEQILQPDEFKKVQKLISDQIKNDAEKHGAFFLRDGKIKDNAALLMNHWRLGSAEEVSEFIENAIDNKSSNAIEFLKSFMPKTYTPEDVMEHSLFEMDQYNAVKRLVSPKIVYEALKKDYGAVMSNPKGIEFRRNKEPFEERLAEVFAYYFLKDDKTER